MRERIVYPTVSARVCNFVLGPVVQHQKFLRGYATQTAVKRQVLILRLCVLHISEEQRVVDQLRNWARMAWATLDPKDVKLTIGLSFFAKKQKGNDDKARLHSRGCGTPN